MAKSRFKKEKPAFKMLPETPIENEKNNEEEINNEKKHLYAIEVPEEESNKISVCGLGPGEGRITLTREQWKWFICDLLPHI